MRTLAIATVVALSSMSVVAYAAPHRVTIYLDRDGEVSQPENGEPAVRIPAFGGGDRVWKQVVGCVREQYAPFDVTIVTERPTAGRYVTAVVGGRASQLGLDDSTTNGVGPYNGEVIDDAVVHVFSQVGTGEKDVENLCAVTAHEVGHALGLDHEYKCGDIMSYFLDQCGARHFMDVEARCGEDEPRDCGNGAKTQSSYRTLANNVGLRPDADSRTPKTPRPEDGDADVGELGQGRGANGDGDGADERGVTNGDVGTDGRGDTSTDPRRDRDPADADDARGGNANGGRGGDADDARGGDADGTRGGDADDARGGDADDARDGDTDDARGGDADDARGRDAGDGASEGGEVRDEQPEADDASDAPVQVQYDEVRVKSSSSTGETTRTTTRTTRSVSGHTTRSTTHTTTVRVRWVRHHGKAHARRHHRHDHPRRAVWVRHQ